MALTKHQRRMLDFAADCIEAVPQGVRAMNSAESITIGSLVRRGLLRAGECGEDEKERSKVIYEITDAGRAALAAKGE